MLITESSCGHTRRVFILRNNLLHKDVITLSMTYLNNVDILLFLSKLEWRKLGFGFPLNNAVGFLFRLPISTTGPWFFLFAFIFLSIFQYQTMTTTNSLHLSLEIFKVDWFNSNFALHKVFSLSSPDQNWKLSWQHNAFASLVFLCFCFLFWWQQLTNFF